MSPWLKGQTESERPECECPGWAPFDQQREPEVGMTLDCGSKLEPGEASGPAGHQLAPEIPLNQDQSLEEGVKLAHF